MSLETFTGSSIPELFAQVNAVIGEDAVLLAVRRLTDGDDAFEVVAADPETAATRKREELARREAASIEAAAAPPPEPIEAPAPEEDGSAPPRGAAPSERPRTVALVGPTGAGKTTTIAKLATHRAAFGGRKVGLICLDTFRAGAVEQLRAYAELASVPLELVYEPDDLTAAMHRLSDRDVLLVDTPGRGPGETQDLAAVAACLERLSPNEVHLVLPAGLAPIHARRMGLRARSFGATHLLPTKLDEYPGSEATAILAEELRLPIRWMTDGQRIPGDLRDGSRAAVEPAVAGRGLAL